MTTLEPQGTLPTDRRLTHRLSSTALTIPRPLVIVAGAAVGLLVVALVVTGWTAGILAPKPHAVAFESEAWRGNPWVRAGMTPSLLKSGFLSGQERPAVQALLGESDGSFDGPSTVGSADMDFDAWMLYRPQDLLLPFPPELVVVYDSNGTVTDAYVEPGMF